MSRSPVFSTVASVAVLAAAVSANASQQEKDVEQTDRLLIQAQRICPVSGKKLGSMGDPIKTEVDERTVFICCKGCIGELKKNPRKALTTVDRHLIDAQKKCPVRNVPLGKETIPVVVKKRAVFVCCGGGSCVKAVKADPDKYIALVDAMLKKNLQAEKKKK